VEWKIAWLRSGALRLDAGAGTPVLFFPGGSEYDPPPLVGGRTTGALDLLFVVDATCRMHDSGHAAHRLAQPDANGLYLSLEAFAQEMAGKYSSASFGVLAFADHPLPDHASATDLVPAELFQPRSFEGRLPFLSVEALKHGFRCLRPSTGVDWVDALAEALALCREWGGWRQDARKLLVVCGDSPGHSVLHPAETECDAHSRMATVEEECHRLHLQGVEIATMFTGQSAEMPSRTALSHRMVEHARAQYRRLASVPMWAWDEQTFASNAAASLSSPPRWLARGTAYGCKLEVTEEYPP